MRATSTALAVLALALAAGEARAQELPPTLQVQLLSKVTTYIADLSAGGDTLKVLVIYPGQKESRGAEKLTAALAQQGQLGKFKVAAKSVGFTDAKKLVATLAVEKPQLIYLAPELEDEAVLAVIGAASASNAVTVSGTEDHVRLGVVLGFSLVEARPRVLINVKQADKQKISFVGGLVSHSVVVETAPR